MGEKDPLEILSFIAERWESLLSCIDRILKLWKYLQIYFADDYSPLKNEIAESEYHIYIYLLYILNERYSTLIRVINEANYNAKEKEQIEKQCFRHARNFLTTVVTSLKKKMPFDHIILNQSLEMYLKTSFNIEV